MGHIQDWEQTSYVDIQVGGHAATLLQQMGQEKWFSHYIWRLKQK